MERFVDDAFEFNVIFLFDIRLHRCQVTELIVLRVSLAVLDDGTPQHEVAYVLAEVFGCVLDVSGELFRELLDIVRPFFLDVLQASREVDSDFADVHLLFLQIDSYDIDLPVLLDSV